MMDVVLFGSCISFSSVAPHVFFRYLQWSAAVLRSPPPVLSPAVTLMVFLSLHAVCRVHTHPGKHV